MKYKDKDTIKCVKCNQSMPLGAIEFKSKNNLDIYWLCENCLSFAFQKIRNDKPCVIKYYDVNIKGITIPERRKYGNIKSNN